MKNSIFAIIVTALLTISSYAQVTIDFEGTNGQRGPFQQNCWFFASTAIKSGSSALNGSWSLRTGQLSNMPDVQAPHRLRTPWIDMVPGNITFSERITALNGGAKYLDVVVLDQNNNVVSTILQKQFTSSDVSNVTNHSIPVNITGIHKVEFRWYGQGGTTRGLMDDLSVPGTYAADPGNSCQPLQNSPVDTDNDTVPDISDEFPNDANSAFNNFFPQPSVFGTLAFEDLWPSQGDYDFNDLVLDYNYNEITNANNNVVRIEISLIVKAVGGTFDNGYAIQLDNVTPSDIASITGQDLTGSLFTLSANGTESGQSQAVIPVFDSAENVITRIGGGSMYNTIPSVGGTGVSETINLVINMDAQTTYAPGTIVYNPFLVVNQQRGVEVHLPDNVPTDLADQSLFGTNNDASNIGTSTYYKTQNNLPWALNMPSSFKHPVEQQDVTGAYLNFAPWAQSGGTNFTDWYSNTSPGYRNDAHIFDNN